MLTHDNAATSGPQEPATPPKTLREIDTKLNALRLERDQADRDSDPLAAQHARADIDEWLDKRNHARR